MRFVAAALTLGLACGVASPVQAKEFEPIYNTAPAVNVERQQQRVQMSIEPDGALNSVATLQLETGSDETRQTYEPAASLDSETTTRAITVKPATGQERILKAITNDADAPGEHPSVFVENRYGNVDMRYTSPEGIDTITIEQHSPNMVSAYTDVAVLEISVHAFLTSAIRYEIKLPVPPGADPKLVEFAGSGSLSSVKQEGDTIFATFGGTKAEFRGKLNILMPSEWVPAVSGDSKRAFNAPDRVFHPLPVDLATAKETQLAEEKEREHRVDPTTGTLVYGGLIALLIFGAMWFSRPSLLAKRDKAQGEKL